MDIFSQLKTISADIRSKNLSPYYYLYGNEFYFIEKILSNIKKSYTINIILMQMKLLNT